MPAFHQSNIQHIWNLMDILYLYDTLIHTSWLRYIRRSPVHYDLHCTEKGDYDVSMKINIFCEYSSSLITLMAPRT